MPDQMRRDQFRPSLLELLRPDLDPVMTETEIRRHVIRDIEWLFNTTGNTSLHSDSVIEAYPNVAASVLNFGLPSMSGDLVGRLEPEVLRDALGKVLERFEPRLQQTRISIVSSKDETVREGTLSFEIEGSLRLDRGTVRIYLRTDVDIGTSTATISDLSDSHA
jgi:type VI secretion system protein ImpF